MNSFIKRLINWKVCLLFSGLFLLYLFLILPNESSKSDLLTGGLVSPDTQFIYSSDDLRDLVSSYSPDAREYYVVSKVRFDILWPLVYGIWLTSSIGLLIRGIKNKGGFEDKTIIDWIPLLPLVAVGFDFLENISVSIVMLTYPDASWIMLSLAPILTALKWLTLNSAMVITVLLFVIYIFKLLKSKQNNKPNL